MERILESDIQVKKLKHCRFCAEETNDSDLYNWSEDVEVSRQFFKVVEALNLECLDLADVLLPTTMCEPCYDAFNAAYLFFDKLKQSQIILKTLYNSNVKCNLSTVLIKIKEEAVSTALYEEERNESPDVPYNVNTNTSQVDTEYQLESVHTGKCEKHSKQKKALKDLSKKSKLYCQTIPMKRENYQTASQSCDTGSKNHSMLVNPQQGMTNIMDYIPQTDVFIASHNNAENSNYSWISYNWICLHCKMVFENMSDLRMHSKQMHNKCYAFKCIDCNEHFNFFYSFVEHVREHRSALRNYCQFCNKKFDGYTECKNHAFSHWSGTQKICSMCGEICPDPKSLDRHRKMYKLVRLPIRDYRKRPRLIVPDCKYNGTSSWEDYEWTCQECCARMPNVHTLRVHAQEFHNKCFAIKCIDCLKVKMSYAMFVKHVTGHRPYLKKFCQYCNQHFENLSDLDKHIAEHMSGPHRPCDGCGQIFENNSLLLQHLKNFDPPRTKGTVTTDDMTCDLCGKLFANLGRLRTHRLTHDKDRKPEHVCDICGKSYYTHYMLSEHIKTHDVTNKNQLCQMCNKVFLTIPQLRAHIRSHVDLKLFSCDECGKQFRTKKQLSGHVVSHMKEMKFHCTICGKGFARKNTLTTHINIHSTSSPFCCKFCEKTFNSWSNCNKHMIRKHGVPLAKTKLTAQGRIDIDKETGQVVSLDTSKNIKEWISEVMKPRKRGKKTNKEDATMSNNNTT